MVYGSKATKGPIELSGRDRQVLLRGKVDQYEVMSLLVFRILIVR